VTCQQCGTENSNANTLCLKCGKPLRSDRVKGVVTCKNHGNRPSVAICYQCLSPICEECAVERGTRTYCVDDANVDVSVNEEERIEHLAIADPNLILHAGFASRVVSFLIDSVILIFAAALLEAVFWLVSGVPPIDVSFSRLDTAPFLLYSVIYMAIVFAYFVLLVASEGQTFGKQAMRIAVVEKDGTTPSLETASLRCLYSIASLLCFGAGFIAILNDPARQAWHDRWANTYVISLDEATERL
jgi:uncharacterized RDD family membrane protein YckC